MNIHFADLYKMQRELLMSFSPRQEFALIHLLVDDDATAEVEGLIELIAERFPFTQRLYKAFVERNEYDNLIPLIIPVSDSDCVLQDVLTRNDKVLEIHSDLSRLLNTAWRAALSAEQTETEDLIRVEKGTPLLTCEWVIDSLLDAFNEGAMPIVVRPSADQVLSRSEKLFNFCKFGELFPATCDYSKALRPTKSERRVNLAQLLN